MIVAAGLGRRLLPLTALRPKPALPVRGLPLIAYPLALLAQAGVREVAINLHHLPEVLRQAALRWRPEGLALRFSPEPALLQTGGAIGRMADFLRESDPCLVLGGDMIVDFDLPALLRAHRESGRAVTALLLDDPRAAHFGSLGLGADGELRRIGARFNLGGERSAGLYTWVNVLSPRAFETLPAQAAFNHLDHWWGPWAQREPGAVGGVVWGGAGKPRCTWQPVGTPPEYLHANLHPAALSYLDADAAARQNGARLAAQCIIGADAKLPANARLHRAVVWDGEQVPPGFQGSDGVFAGGRFHPCLPAPGRRGENSQRSESGRRKETLQ
ncbi:MAG: sugar phosphate nucleotidyltransferase [Deltaproteobacteria bacterium]|nr:sugar phosphate nucleotidyltransferase [Deltaproteobacteria bacterium]